TAAALSTAVRWRDRFMAHLGLVGGLLTPILLSSGRNAAVALFSYLALLAAGAVWAAARRGWGDLVVTAGLGVGLIATLWTGRYHQPDQVPIGLVAPLILALPFAIAGAGRRVDPSVAMAGTGGALLLPLLSTAWIVPLDPLFVDARTGQSVLRDLGAAPWFVAAALPMIAAPAWIVALSRRWGPVGLAGSLVLAAASLVATAAWSVHQAPPPLALAALSLAPVALATLLPAWTAPWTAALPAIAGLAVAIQLGEGEPRPGVALLQAAVVVLGLLGAGRSRSALWLGSAALGATLVGLAGAAHVTDYGALAVGGPALLAYALLSPLPLVARRFPTAPQVPVLLGAAAGPALFAPLYFAWVEGWTDAAIGLLPLSLGAVALLTGATLARARRVGRGDAALALFVAVALLGLSTALPLQLERQWLTIAWAVEGALLAALSRRLHHPLLRVASVALGLSVAVRLLLNPWALEYGEGGGLPILNWTLYTWGLPALCLLASARLLAPKDGRAQVPAFVPPTLRVLAVLVGFALVQVQVSHLFQDAGPIELGGHGLLQGMVRSLASALYGVAVLVGGLVAGHRHVRLVGFALVLLATGKVFAVDLWALSGFARVGSVLGLGVTLLLSAFLFERLVLRSERTDPEAS
ncbi:DUF2339 domain-containing protein, partial [Myxococcota bacterium]|nr:DUF2339 domain-containing protein [Myxococcota bacterium]